MVGPPPLSHSSFLSTPITIDLTLFPSPVVLLSLLFRLPRVYFRLVLPVILFVSTVSSLLRSSGVRTDME